LTNHILCDNYRNRPIKYNLMNFIKSLGIAGFGVVAVVAGGISLISNSVSVSMSNRTYDAAASNAVRSYPEFKLVSSKIDTDGDHNTTVTMMNKSNEFVTFRCDNGWWLGGNLNGSCVNSVDINNTKVKADGNTSSWLTEMIWSANTQAKAKSNAEQFMKTSGLKDYRVVEPKFNSDGDDNTTLEVIVSGKPITLRCDHSWNFFGDPKGGCTPTNDYGKTGGFVK
jgi:hypothetical protein